MLMSRISIQALLAVLLVLVNYGRSEDKIDKIVDTCAGSNGTYSIHILWDGKEYTDSNNKLKAQLKEVMTSHSNTQVVLVNIGDVKPGTEEKSPIMGKPDSEAKSSSTTTTAAPAMEQASKDSGKAAPTAEAKTNNTTGGGETAGKSGGQAANNTVPTQPPTGGQPNPNGGQVQPTTGVTQQQSQGGAGGATIEQNPSPQPGADSSKGGESKAKQGAVTSVPMGVGKPGESTGALDMDGKQEEVPNIQGAASDQSDEDYELNTIRWSADEITSSTTKASGKEASTAPKETDKATSDAKKTEEKEKKETTKAPTTTVVPKNGSPDSSKTFSLNADAKGDYYVMGEAQSAGKMDKLLTKGFEYTGRAFSKENGGPQNSRRKIVNYLRSAKTFDENTLKDYKEKNKHSTYLLIIWSDLAKEIIEESTGSVKENCTEKTIPTTEGASPDCLIKALSPNPQISSDYCVKLGLYPTVKISSLKNNTEFTGIGEFTTEKFLTTLDTVCHKEVNSVIDKTETRACDGFKIFNSSLLRISSILLTAGLLQFFRIH